MIASRHPVLLPDVAADADEAAAELGPFWRSEEILDALDAFAARAGRRQRVRPSE
ncbi:hypothetical protein M3D75_12630 [Microbacterium enclense]|uniref:hypothetical protein n=1 Tax=Microbacterium enclense TaxID=993073 RepID=UPI0021A8831A|nr:hypothetical protein [Microbacterium enclense]MCT2086966.1 hypothetical protein [Microbacterium enclense]